jgi:hypothetical protein
MNKKVNIGRGIGCAVLCIASIIIILIAGGCRLREVFLTEPENVSISVDAPVQVTKDESVIIEVQVENTAIKPQLLNSIDISSEYLAGIAIIETEPPFVESFLNPPVEIQTYKFMQEISPGTTLVVQFFGVAVKTGDFSGNIDICINSGSICTTTFTIRTVVEE